MVLVPPWRRPSEGASIGNHEARIRALERQSGAGGGDYIFVEEHAPSSDTFLFSSIPQDARHLVIFMVAGGGTLRLIVNGDTGANYDYLTETLIDNAGVLTDVQASFRGVSNIPLKALESDGARGHAVITIPYYRLVPVGAESGTYDRTIEVEAWQKWLNVPSVVDIIRHEKIAGFWTDPAPVLGITHPITSIQISALSGVGGRASLYKVM